MLQLESQRVVLTGAAGGIGSLVALRLRQRGAHVTSVDRIANLECEVSLISDLADREALAELAKALAERRVDILINLAGLQYFGPLEHQGADAIALGYAVNLVAPAILAGAAMPQMIERGLGQIVNIGSVMGAVPYPYFTAYSSAKAGLKGLSQALRRELAGRGVSVTHIAPRAVRTRFNTSAIEQFMAMTGMNADRPDVVADRIVTAIVRRERDVSIGIAERVFTQLNAAAPGMIDRGLRRQIAAARSLFAN